MEYTSSSTALCSHLSLLIQPSLKALPSPAELHHPVPATPSYCSIYLTVWSLWTKPTCFLHLQGKPQTLLELLQFLGVFLDVHQDSGRGTALTKLCFGVPPGTDQCPISPLLILFHGAGTHRTDGLTCSQLMKHHHLLRGKHCGLQHVSFVTQWDRHMSLFGFQNHP